MLEPKQGTVDNLTQEELLKLPPLDIGISSYIQDRFYVPEKQLEFNFEGEKDERT